MLLASTGSFSQTSMISLSLEEAKSASVTFILAALKVKGEGAHVIERQRERRDRVGLSLWR